MRTQKTTIEFTVTKGIPVSAPTVSNFNLPSSKLRHISVGIPPGHKALAHLQVSIPGYGIIIPGAASNVLYIRGENDRIEFDFDLNLDPPKNTIQLSGYNDDTLLDHTFILNIDTELYQ